MASRDTTTGLEFEKRVTVNRSGINLSQDKLYQYLKTQNIDYTTILSRKLKPDEAYLEDDHLYIYEKKFQKTEGSADEKPQTCAFKIWEFRKIGAALGIKPKNVTYTYILTIGLNKINTQICVILLNLLMAMIIYLKMKQEEKVMLNFLKKQHLKRKRKLFYDPVNLRAEHHEEGKGKGGDIWGTDWPIPVAEEFEWHFYDEVDNGKQYITTKLTDYILWFIPFSYDEFVYEFTCWNI